MIQLFDMSNNTFLTCIFNLILIIATFFKSSFHDNLQISTVAFNQNNAAKQISTINCKYSLCDHENLHLKIEEFIKFIHFKSIIFNIM